MANKEKNVNVLPKNEGFLETFVNKIYGSPNSWGKGNGLLVKGYPYFKIESKKDFFDKEYKTRIVLSSSLSKYEREKLTYIAKAKDLSSSEVDRIVEEAKKDLSWKLRMG